MIKIILDLNKLVSNSEGLLIADVADYVPAYSEMLLAFENKDDLTVYVQNPAVKAWLERMAKRYPEGSFIFESWDARQFLEGQWELEIPEQINPDEIMASGLLDLDIAPHPGADFDDVILGYFYGTVFTARNFPFAHLAELLLGYDDKIWRTNEKNQLVYRTYQNRLTQWQEKGKIAEVRSLVELIIADIKQVKHQLMLYKVLRFYKEIGIQLLGDHYQLFETLRPELRKLPIDEDNIQDAIVQVRYLLENNPSPDTTKDLIAQISLTSGLLMAEFDHFEKILLSNPGLVTKELILSLEDKFSPLQSRVGKRISRLSDLIQPEKPDEPGQNWDLPQMLRWVTEKYLPYQSWCDRNEIIDHDLFAFGDQFALWLYDNWHEVRLNSGHMVYNMLPNHTSMLKQKDVVNLVLIIDNLSWTFAEKLQSSFEERGFFITKVEPYLSMLPSETEISKKCLLSGSPSYNDIDTKNYTAIIEKGWVPYFNQASFQYISDIGKLGQITEVKNTTYFVNYLAVDNALHTSSSQLGIPHQQHVIHLLSGLVEAVLDFINKHDLKQKINIHVVSDHGAIRIPKKIHNALDPKDYKKSDFPNTSHRYTTVSNERFAILPDNLKEDCFFLDSTEFGNPQHYLCTRRANRFLETDGTFYTHGGLTPEEMVVPHMIFEAVKLPVKELTLILTNDAFRYRQETIPLRIGNPNDSSVEDVVVSITNSNIEAEPETIPWINGNSDLLIHFDGLINQTSNPEDRSNLTFHIRFTHRGERQSQTVKVPITMRTMFELKDSTLFDDLD